MYLSRDLYYSLNMYSVPRDKHYVDGTWVRQPSGPNLRTGSKRDGLHCRVVYMCTLIYPWIFARSQRLDSAKHGRRKKRCHRRLSTLSSVLCGSTTLPTATTSIVTFGCCKNIPNRTRTIFFISSPCYKLCCLSSVVYRPAASNTVTISDRRSSGPPSPDITLLWYRCETL